MTEHSSSDHNDAALAAIREALRHPVVMSAQQERAFHKFRKRSLIRRCNTLCRERGGKLQFRRVGKPGAYSPVPPIEWDVVKAHRRFFAQLALLTPRRPPASALGVAANQKKASDRQAPVVAALALYAGRGRHRTAVVARKTGEDAHYIRRVIRRTYTTENSDRI